jgi:spermidine/putrescine transport system substrate-binding protein
MKKTLLAMLCVLVIGLMSCDRRQPASPGAPAQINILCWSEYIPQELVQNYMQESHVKVNLDTVDSNEAMKSKLLAGGTKYGLVQPSEYFVEQLIKANQLTPLDMGRVPNFKNILPEFTNQPFDPGNKYTVPYMSGTVGIVYNAEKIKDPIKGFADVFKPEHAARIIVVNDNREIVSWAMLVQGIPINDITPQNLEKVRPTLAQWVKLIKKYDSDSPKTDLLQGNVDIGIVWNGEAAKVIDQDKRFKWVVPAEGTHRYIDNLAIPVNATNREAAHEFINFCLAPENGKLIADAWPYTCPNGETRKLLSKQQLENPASYPELKDPQTFRDIGTRAADIDKLMTELRG